jgi:hypothetical protein
MRAVSFAAIAFTMAASLAAIAQSEPPATDTTSTTTSTTTAPATTTVKDSALVRAAKQSGTKKKMPKKVITNEDVRKSKGKVSVTQLKPLPPNSDAKSVTDTVGPVERADTQRRAHKVAEERMTAAQKKFNGLEKDLAAIEQSYYEEKDLNLRDNAIQKRFAQTKRQLDDARKEVADARDALSALTSKQ